MSLQTTLRALADPTRREILELLKHGPLPAGKLAAHFPIAGASVSRHLSVLKDAQLVRDRRSGQFIYYELNASILEEAMLWMAQLKGDDPHEKHKP